jgi:alanyl-tRNA synthetase
LVDDQRLRFDFTHFKPITPAELDRIEDLVNNHIRANDNVTATIMNLEEAKAAGALAFFGEKYLSDVRVVNIGEYSKELCGGVHLASTGEIGLFRIVSESSIAAGIRRIEAVTGKRANDLMRQDREIISQLTQMLKTSVTEIPHVVKSLSELIKSLEKEINRLKFESLKAKIDKILAHRMNTDGIAIISEQFEEIPIELLRALLDLIRQRVHAASIIILGSTYRDKVCFVTGLTQDLVEKGLRAPALVNAIAQITEGGGGGRPDLAQAGGKNPSKLSEALSKVPEIVKQHLAKTSL